MGSLDSANAAMLFYDRMRKNMARPSVTTGMTPSPVGGSSAARRPYSPPRGAAGGPGISGWAEATGRPFRHNPSGSISFDQPAYPGLGVGAQLPSAPGSRGPNSVRERLQAAINRSSGRGGNSAVDSLFGVLSDEQQRTQDAADRQFGRNNEQISSYGDFLGNLNPSLMGVADQGASMLYDAAGQAIGLGDAAVAGQQGRGDAIMSALNGDLARVEGTAGRIEGDANTALGYAAAGVRAASNAAGNYQSDSQANISATVAGINRQMQTRSRLVNSGLNPDGTMMTPAERQAAQRQLTFDTMQATSGVVSQMREEQSRIAASLGMQLAGTNISAGQIALGAAGARSEAGRMREGVATTRAGVGTTVAGQAMDAERIRANYRQLSASLLESGGNMRNAANALAMQLESQGRTAMAEMVRNNPESVVSRFASLLQLYSVSSAPGGGSIRAIG